MGSSLLQILILGLDKAWATAKFDLVSSVYFSVAKIYDYLIQLNENTGYFDLFTSENFVGLSQAIYVFAGIFMLFRVTIAMINMIINPDLVTSSDSNGGSKLLTRIITSLLMLIMFTPKGWIFNPYDGIVMKLERGILDSMGNFMYGLTGEEAKKTSLSNISVLESVDAATNNLTCYYYERASITSGGSNDGSKKSDASKTYNISDVHKIIFYPTKVSGAKATKCGSDTCYYKVDTSESGFTKLSADIVDAGKISRGLFNHDQFANNSKCPTMTKTSSGYDANATQKTNTPALIGFKNKQDLDKQIMKIVKDKNSTISSDNEYVLNLMNLGVSESALNFARGVAKSFQQCQSDVSKSSSAQQKDIADCEALQDTMFSPSAATDAIVKLITDGILRIDTITSIIIGIIIMIYLAFICVEVIVRRFKLMLLEVMAPIPIIAYSDPKDETFAKWSKMYVSTFAELFMKLLAIKIGIVLLEFVYAQLSSTKGLLTKFLYIVAILLFMKLIPDMISNIFGIKVGSGSFKDIWNTGKKALATAVGVPVGAAVGAATAPGGFFGKTAGAFKGAIRGAGGGAKGGDPFAGSRSIAADNYKMQDAIAANGGKKMKLHERMLVGAQTTLGLRTNADTAEGRKQINQASQDTIKAIQDAADSISKAIQKGSSKLTQIGALEGRGIISGNTAKEFTGAVDKAISAMHRDEKTHRIKDDEDFSITLGELVRGGYLDPKKVQDLHYDEETGKYSLVGKDGNKYMDDGDTFAITSPYLKGVTSAEDYYEKRISDAKSNKTVSDKLLSLDAPVDLDAAGTDEKKIYGATGATKVVATTFNADAELKRELVEIEKDLRELKPTDDFVKGK